MRQYNLLQTLLSFHSLETNIIFHTMRLIFCFQQDRWDWQPHCFVGGKYLGCVVCRFHVAAEPGSAPCQHQLSTTFRSNFFLLLVRLNLGFLLREKLVAVLIITSSSGLPTNVCPHAIKIFSGAVAGEEEDFSKGSLSPPISLLCLCFAQFLLFCLVFFFISKTHKN